MTRNSSIALAMAIAALLFTLWMLLASPLAEDEQAAMGQLDKPVTVAAAADRPL